MIAGFDRLEFLSFETFENTDDDYDEDYNEESPDFLFESNKFNALKTLEVDHLSMRFFMTHSMKNLENLKM